MPYKAAIYYLTCCYIGNSVMGSEVWLLSNIGFILYHKDGRFLVIRATNRKGQNLNGHKPKRPQTEMATNRNGHRPKWPQTETATNRNGHTLKNSHKPERPQTGTSTNLNGHKLNRRILSNIYRESGISNMNRKWLSFWIRKTKFINLDICAKWFH